MKFRFDQLLLFDCQPVISIRDHLTLEFWVQECKSNKEDELTACLSLMYFAIPRFKFFLTSNPTVIAIQLLTLN